MNRGSEPAIRGHLIDHLPIALVSPDDGGGLAVQALPRPQSNRFRLARVSPEYVRVASEAVARVLKLLGAERLADGFRMIFVEPIGGPPPGSAQLGYAGFYSDQTPDAIYVVAPWVPLAALPWLVTHEAAHQLYFLAKGHDGSRGPDDPDGPSERFAHRLADELCGPCPLLPDVPRPLLAGRAAERAELEGGIAQSGGAIVVNNSSGAVVIDGTSNMFKIAATGTLTTSSYTGTGTQTKHVTHTTNLGAGYRPANLLYLLANIGGVNQAQLLPWTYPTTNWWYGGASAYSSTQTRMWAVSQANGTGDSSRSYRYYILKEAGI